MDEIESIVCFSRYYTRGFLQDNKYLSAQNVMLLSYSTTLQKTVND